MRKTLAYLIIIIAAATGCSTVVTKSELGWEAPKAYQTIANALPSADIGFGEAPGVVDMAASTRREGIPEKPDLSLVTNEEAFKIRIETLRPRLLRIPYDTITEISARWMPFPNVPLILPIIVPLQATETRVVFDATKIPGFLSEVEADCSRLERLSGETAVASPYYHALDIRTKLRDDAEAYGQGKVSVTFVRWVFVPPWIPYVAESRRLADAFAFARGAATSPSPSDGH